VKRAWQLHRDRLCLSLRTLVNLAEVVVGMVDCSCLAISGIPFRLQRFFVILLGCALALTGCAHRSSQLPEIAPGVFGQLYLPSSPMLHAAVLVLHGSGGMRPAYHREAAFLADHGYAALVLDYYAEVGFGGLTSAQRAQRWQYWQDSIRRGLAYLAHHPQIDGTRLAVVGFSQGAALALTTAATPEVAAVVDYFGPNPGGWYVSRFMGYAPYLPADYLDRLPPVLILHGTRDTTVDIAASSELEAALRQRAKLVEFIVYPDGQHALNDPNRGSAGTAAVIARDARERALYFLNTHLTPRAGAP